MKDNIKKALQQISAFHIVATVWVSASLLFILISIFYPVWTLVILSLVSILLFVGALYFTSAVGNSTSALRILELAFFFVFEELAVRLLALLGPKTRIELANRLVATLKLLSVIGIMVSMAFLMLSVLSLDYRPDNAAVAIDIPALTPISTTPTMAPFIPITVTIENVETTPAVTFVATPTSPLQPIVTSVIESPIATPVMITLSMRITSAIPVTAAISPYERELIRYKAIAALIASPVTIVDVKQLGPTGDSLIYIANFGAQDVSLSGWSLSEHGQHEFVFGDTLLTSRSILEVYFGSSQEVPEDALLWSTDESPANRVIQLVLRNERDAIVDRWEEDILDESGEPIEVN